MYAYFGYFYGCTFFKNLLTFYILGLPDCDLNIYFRPYQVFVLLTDGTLNKVIYLEIN